MKYQITPAVDAVREFLEIAGDFTDPLEVVREAISNSIDAGSEVITIEFSAQKQAGRQVIQILIRDEGHGMKREDLQSFFDLGNSSKRGNPALIGEKGHGTKVFFNCQSLEVKTVRDGSGLIAKMLEPFSRLHAGQLPEVSVEDLGNTNDPNGTTITILGFNNNDGEVFTHDRLRDYIHWFTKFGSVEQQFGISDHKDKKLWLKGLDRVSAEELHFGHFFPDNSKPIKLLFEEHVVKAPDHYCKRICESIPISNSMLYFRWREIVSSSFITGCSNGLDTLLREAAIEYKNVMVSGFARTTCPSSARTSG